MRVLRIFHSAVVDAWRERERHLRALGAEVDLVTARRWNEGGADVRLIPRPGEPVRGLRTWGTAPRALRLLAAPAVARPRPAVRRHRRPGGAVRPRHGRDPAAAPAAPPAGAVRPLLRPEHRQALPAAVPLARTLGPAQRRRTERLQQRGRPHLRAQGPAGRATLIPLGVDIERVLPRRAVARPDDRAASSGTSAGWRPTRASTSSSRRSPGSTGSARASPAPARRRAACALATDGAGLDERVEFVGSLDQEQLPDFYRGLDVLAVPSLPTPGWLEQFGRVVVEAMACGVPVVASDTGALPDVVGDAGAAGAARTTPTRWPTPETAARRRARPTTSWRGARPERARHASWPEVAARLPRPLRASGARPPGDSTRRGVEVVVVAYGRPDLLADALRAGAAPSRSRWSTTPPRPRSPRCAPSSVCATSTPGATAGSGRASTTPWTAGSTRTPTSCCSTPTP